MRDLIEFDPVAPAILGSVQRRIRAAQATIGVAPTPLIALTANAAEEDRHAAEAAGFAAFFVKPFDAAALTRAVAGLVRAAPAREGAREARSPLS